MSPIRASLSIQKALSVNSSLLHGFSRAFSPQPIIFPRDHGLHSDFKTEWWYFTGNLHTKDGRRFGYQLTFFRNALSAPPSDNTSDSSSWSAQNIFMAHCTLTDVQSGQFYSVERFNRLAQNLAGCAVQQNDSSARFRLWIDDWQVTTICSSQNLTPVAIHHSIFPMRVEARGSKEISFRLTIDSIKPTTLQGDRGFSMKSSTPGNASFYYSLTRLRTTGVLTIRNEKFTVEGTSWMDREWSTSALEKNQVGWDWFAFHLDDGRDIMFYQLRRILDNGQQIDDTTSAGVIVAPNGSSKHLLFSDVILHPTSFWVSPSSNTTYPTSWSITIPHEQIDIQIQPLLQEQELQTTVRYWEGAVRVLGKQKNTPLSGYGYLEMTGYSKANPAVN